MKRRKYKTALMLALGVTLAAPVTPALAGQARPKLVSASKTVDHAVSRVTRHFDQSYKDFGKELKLYVEFGNVHYRKWQQHQGGLDKFLKAVEHLDKREYDSFTPDEKLAFWLNVYNALTIKTVLDYYPIHGTLSQYPPDSFRQIPNDWECVQFKVMGQGITLYTIEHEKIRRDLADPRTHFAEVCASRSCAQITAEPFIGAKLQTQLDDATRRFMADPDNILIDASKNTFMASKIFSWFTLDFARRGNAAGSATVSGSVAAAPTPATTTAPQGAPASGSGTTVKPRAFAPPADEDIIADYVAPYLAQPQRDALMQIRQSKAMRFDYLPYDWALNDADGSGINKN